METAPFFKSAVSLEEIPILSVSEISQTLKRFVEGNFNKLRVQGEISGLKRHTSGHSYFALKDKDAVLDGICWRGTVLGITLEEGLEVIVQGRLTTYPGRSKYQIVIESAKAAGQGAHPLRNAAAQALVRAPAAHCASVLAPPSLRRGSAARARARRLSLRLAVRRCDRENLAP